MYNVEKLTRTAPCACEIYCLDKASIYIEIAHLQKHVF